MAGARTFTEYRDRYEHVEMARDDQGVLLLRLHSDGGPVVWGDAIHTELPYCFGDVAADPGNRVVVLTGTGGEFIRRLDDSWVGAMTPERWDKILHHGRRLLEELLDIEVPVVAAVNGPALVHAELAVLSDIVLAAESATFADAAHFPHGTVSGDGAHLVWPMLLGPNRARYFLYTGQRLSARDAWSLGVVSEVLPDDGLLGRALELAANLAHQPDLTLRYTRQATMAPIRAAMSEHLRLGLALEGLGAHASWPTGA